MASPQEKIYTLEDIYTLPDGEWAELIDGRIYNMAPPNRIHQKISWKLYQTITNYVTSEQGNCEVYAAPFSVFLQFLKMTKTMSSRTFLSSATRTSWMTKAASERRTGSLRSLPPRTRKRIMESNSINTALQVYGNTGL